VTFPILVKAREGQFDASLAGAPNVRVQQPTRSGAIAALKVEIQQWIERGELLSLEIETVGVSGLAGTYSDDPTLSEICDQAYQIRDVDRRA
jgi:hypothetical protein